MNSWTTIYKCLWVITIVLIVIVMISFFVPKYRTLRDYQKKRYDLQHQNRQTEAMVGDLKHKQEQILTDPAFIERTARGLGMVKPDEKVFKFTNSPPYGITNVLH